MKTLKDFNFENKKVLVRCDFNLPLDKKGNIEDDFRLEEAIPTIKHLIKNKAKVILMSHLGSPKGKIVEELRLFPIQKRLEELLDISIKKTSDCIGQEVEKEVSQIKQGEALLLENLRFHKGEEDNDPQFAQELAELGDIYINDAFSVSHRKHSSVSAICDYLPAGAGFLLEKEVKILSRVLEKPWRPLVAIIGGAKISNKIKLIKEFLEEADQLLIGGKIANSILIVKGLCIGRPWPEEEVVEEVNNLELTSNNFHLPVDVMVSPDETGKTYVRASAPAKARKDEMILDIGPETIDFFSQIIKGAKMIIWAGPMGFFENPLFEKGTKGIAKAIIRNHKAYKIVGGGDTIFALSKFGLRDKFDHVSTGGGAMLSFLSKEELPGLKALENNEKTD